MHAAPPCTVHYSALFDVPHLVTCCLVTCDMPIRHGILVTVVRPWYTFDVFNFVPIAIQTVVPIIDDEPEYEAPAIPDPDAPSSLFRTPTKPRPFPALGDALPEDPGSPSPMGSPGLQGSPCACLGWGSTTCTCLLIVAGCGLVCAPACGSWSVTDGCMCWCSCGRMCSGWCWRRRRRGCRGGGG